MPRTSRKRSETGFYHVILRGNGKQNLFETDKDRAAFMEAARSSFSRDSVTLIAWCLMDNHVHLIIDDPLDRISTAIQRVTSTYAMYFNHSFGHSGHVFEGRYGSVPIIDDEQLLAAVKYVHNNPLKGMGITPDRYPWCSYSEYASGVSRFADIDTLLELLGGTQAFVMFSINGNATGYRPAFKKYADEDERITLAQQVFESFGCTATGVKELPKKTRNQVLKALCECGLTVKHVQRLTGIGEWTIRNAAGRVKKR